jgi:hypothetical protein
MNLTLYCNSYAGKDPLHNQCNQKTLMCGSYYLDSTIKKQCIEQEYILDDTLQNISHLNYLLGDLTGLYWIWKNTNDEFVGTNQYRRFYDDNQLNSLFPLDEKTIYVSEFIEFNTSVWNQYIYSHTDLGMKMLKKAVNLKSIKMNESMFDCLNHTTKLSSCNTFFANKNLFDKTCEILFEIIFELYRGSKYLLEFTQFGHHTGRDANEKRLLAFLAERILNIIYINKNYFFGNINIIPIKFNYYLKQNGQIIKTN